MSKIKTPKEFMGIKDSQLDSESKYWLMQIKAYHEYAMKAVIEDIKKKKTSNGSLKVLRPTNELIDEVIEIIKSRI